MCLPWPLLLWRIEEAPQGSQAEFAHLARAKSWIPERRLDSQAVDQRGHLDRRGMWIDGGKFARGTPCGDDARQETRPTPMLPLAHGTQPFIARDLTPEGQPQTPLVAHLVAGR